jgi:DUF4097 and DUF4098 domain-containing protein YvlB
VVETRDLEATGRFELENVNGAITITTWNEPRVRIEADKAAATDEALRDLKVEIEGEGSTVRVRTRTRRASWFFGGGGKVDYRVTVPVGARLRVENVNGGIEITAPSGDVKASTTNGSIDVREASGSVEATSVNGGVRAAYAKMAESADHRFSTVNGSITLALPEGAIGRVEATTVNGSIDNELSLESTGKATRRRLEGRLGKGGGSLEANTVNGSIRLRRS